MSKKKRDKKKDDLFEEKVEKEEVEETEEEETEEEEEAVEVSTAKVSPLKEGLKFAVQKTGKGIYSVVNHKMEIVRSYDEKEVDDAEGCANSYCEKLFKASL